MLRFASLTQRKSEVCPRLGPLILSCSFVRASFRPQCPRQAGRLSVMFFENSRWSGGEIPNFQSDRGRFFRLKCSINRNSLSFTRFWYKNCVLRAFFEKSRHRCHNTRRVMVWIQKIPNEILVRFLLYIWWMDLDL